MRDSVKDKEVLYQTEGSAEVRRRGRVNQEFPGNYSDFHLSHHSCCNNFCNQHSFTSRLQQYGSLDDAFGQARLWKVIKLPLTLPKLAYIFFSFSYSFTHMYVDPKLYDFVWVDKDKYRFFYLILFALQKEQRCT